MASDCAHNTTGPAFIATQEIFVTYCITFVFFMLCVEPEWKETLQMKKQLESTTGTILEGETLISQMTLLLGTTPSENTKIQHRNMPEDISDILGTRIYQRYMDTPLQTLDGIIVNQPKQFLPLTEEAKRIAEEIRIEKMNEQWAGIPLQ